MSYGIKKEPLWYEIQLNGKIAFPQQYKFLQDIFEKYEELRDIYFLKEIVDLKSNKLKKREHITYYQASEVISMIIEKEWLNETDMEIVWRLYDYTKES